MNKVLVIDATAQDGQPYRRFLAKDGLEAQVCDSAVAGERAVAQASPAEFLAAIIAWELPGPPFAFELLAYCRRVRPELPVMIVAGVLDASLAVRAVALGARGFLERPLDSESLRAAIRRFRTEQDPAAPLVAELRKKVLGESPVLLNCLQQVAKVIPHDDTRVLLLGESGTGKELLAQAVHRLSRRCQAPWVAVNMGAIPKDLVESALFGHEKGAFTGASERHIGCFEEAGEGVLFLDEIGDLDTPLQVKLLRVIQEKNFRRLKGSEHLPFKARLVTATHQDLPEKVRDGIFRQDLYHRIAEVTIRVPSLRERTGDIDLLLDYFLTTYETGHCVRLARETRAVLRTYPFPGNVRELENCVKAALIDCQGEVLLPTHLPLHEMGVFLESPKPERLSAFTIHWPAVWLIRPYHEAMKEVTCAFDRSYLPEMLEKAGHNITKASSISGIDPKTFRKRWQECGLPPLRSSSDTDHG